MWNQKNTSCLISNIFVYYIIPLVYLFLGGVYFYLITSYPPFPRTFTTYFGQNLPFLSHFAHFQLTTNSKYEKPCISKKERSGPRKDEVRSGDARTSRHGCASKQQKKMISAGYHLFFWERETGIELSPSVKSPVKWKDNTHYLCAVYNLSTTCLQF